MDRTEFVRQLKEHGIDPNIVSFEDNIADGYGIRKNHFRWEVFLRERGTEYNCIGFPSESDALRYLLDRLVPIYEKINGCGEGSQDRSAVFGQRGRVGLKTIRTDEGKL